MKRLAPFLLALSACTGEISNPELGAPGQGSPGSGANASGGSSGAGDGTGAAATAGGAGTPSGTPTSCSTTTQGLIKPRVWRLTHAQMANSLRDQFAFVPPSVNDFPTEARLEGFANRSDELRVSPLLAEGYYRAGEELGAQALKAPAAFGINCAVTDLKAGACLTGFINTLGQKMWRRPLSETETASFSKLFETTAAQGEGPGGGVKAVVLGAFLSANFLHRSELGTTQVAGAVSPLTDYEIASALSYTLWDTAPDAPLIELAQQGKLHDRAVLLDQAKRLLGSVSRASPAMHYFVQQWLFIEHLTDTSKDMTVFPNATDEVAHDLLEETQLLMDSVLFDAGGDRSFKTLFTANYSFVNERTAPLYGIMGVTGTKMVRRDLDTKQRRGIFSTPAFMWAHANSDSTNLVNRGAYFRGEVLCDQVPPPPPGIVPDAKFADETATGRERFTAHSQPACAGCHKLFDGLGFAMESYDAIGRYRSMDRNKPIDPSGSIPLPSRPSGPNLDFADFPDLLSKLSNEPDTYSCFASQYLTYASGRAIADVGSCERQQLASEFAKAGYSVEALILNIVGNLSFTERQN